MDFIKSSFGDKVDNSKQQQQEQHTIDDFLLDFFSHMCPSFVCLSFVSNPFRFLNKFFIRLSLYLNNKKIYQVREPRAIFFFLCIQERLYLTNLVMKMFIRVFHLNIKKTSGIKFCVARECHKKKES